MFMGMLEGMKEETVTLLFNAQVQAQAPGPALGSSVSDMLAGSALGGGEAAAEDAEAQMTYSGPAEDGSTEVRSAVEELYSGTPSEVLSAEEPAEAVTGSRKDRRAAERRNRRRK
jgi:preprotein translocase subunit SecA